MKRELSGLRELLSVARRDDKPLFMVMILTIFIICPFIAFYELFRFLWRVLFG